MKKFCRYAVVEVETACLLVCGQKWKDFENSPVRFVKTGTFRCLSTRFHKVTEYFRDIEIRGRFFGIGEKPHDFVDITVRYVYNYNRQKKLEVILCLLQQQN